MNNTLDQLYWPVGYGRNDDEMCIATSESALDNLRPLYKNKKWASEVEDPVFTSPGSR